MKCKDCKWRIDGYCENKHIHGCDFDAYTPDNDCLIYDHDEGGRFKAGENFGCIYFEKKQP